MKILLTEFDLFKNVGGGQTVYRQIIKLRPQDTFYYFVEQESLNAVRPANTVAIPFKKFYYSSIERTAKQKHFYDIFLQTYHLAASIAAHLGNITFDVVDTPDYQQFGLFIREALKQHSIEVGSVVLAMHGVVSSTMKINWPDPLLSLEKLVAKSYLRERLQFRTVDARYAISPMYIEKSRYANLAVNFLDPLCLLENPRPTRSPKSSSKPDLCFIGRKERCKGPDLFVDLIWWVNQTNFRDAILIGPDGFNETGIGSDAILKRAAKLRDVNVKHITHLDRSALLDFFKEKNLVILPSRLDQLNLVALESLLNGCPTFISEKAGVAKYLREKFPHIPVEIFKLDCSRSAASSINQVLENYDAYRNHLVDILEKNHPIPEFETVQSIYDVQSAQDRVARNALQQLTQDFLLHHAPRSSSHFYTETVAFKVKKLLKTPHKKKLRRIYHAFKNRQPFILMKDFYKNNLEKLGINPRLLLQFYYGNFKKIISLPETTTNDKIIKKQALDKLVNRCFVKRIHLFRELIRLHPQSLVSAVYALRIMRWLQKDFYNDLPWVQKTLIENGYAEEAKAAAAMFSEKNSVQECKMLLEQAYQRNLNPPTAKASFEVFADHRHIEKPTVSVIVSLYNAADKFLQFVDMLKQQTLVQMEVIFVDSHSPTDEFSLFKEFMTSTKMSALYIRTDLRETIQTAWNHGIQQARGEYLAFLGADEGVHPQAFEILSAELNADLTLDWVMSNSVVTTVDRKGVFNHDVMKYDRTHAQQHWCYLDCTYLSYVGGLYRKSIHSRFGYYDESFRGAGDTEFKNRILPFIKTKFIPQTLGVFNDYPQERATASPVAEIEDLRAWYLHRTEAGMEYAFGKNPQAAIQLLKETLTYKKSFLAHKSTDFDLALSLIQFLIKRFPENGYQELHQDIEKSIQYFQKLETGQSSSFKNICDWFQLKRMAKKHRRSLQLVHKLSYGIFNDNRYEQHFWAWEKLV